MQAAFGASIQTPDTSVNQSGYIHCYGSPTMDVVKALNHVHSNTDAENQWKRAVSAMGKLTNFERARAWIDFSVPVAQMEYSKAIVAHSQRRELYERCVCESALQLNVDDTPSSDMAEALLKETTQELKKCRGLLQRFVVLACRLDLKVEPYTNDHSAVLNEFSEIGSGTGKKSQPVKTNFANSNNTSAEVEVLKQQLMELKTNFTNSNNTSAEVESLKTKFTELNETVIQLSRSLGSVLTLTEKNSNDLTESNESLMRDFNHRLDSLKTDIETKLNGLESMPKTDLPQESGIDDTPIRPVTTSTDIIEAKQKLEMIDSEIKSMQERYNILEQACIHKLAISINSKGQLGPSPVHVKYSPFTGARKCKPSDPPYKLDQKNPMFITRPHYLDEIKAKLDAGISTNRI
jgi:hypothetical protein